MLPFVLSVLGGGVVAYTLIETELAIPVFLGTALFIVLLFLAPTLAWWLLALVTIYCVGMFALAWLPQLIGVALGFIMFFFLVLGLIHAL